jgi:mannose-6-phosphate isomerase
MKLRQHLVEKPWGRTVLPQPFASTGDRRIGEIWFEPPDGNQDLPLLTKYIFTSEKLSIQVHPGEQYAQSRGARGKSECWYILDCELGATLGLGLRRAADKAELYAAALDGSIEDLVHWRPVSAGEFYFVPPGTVHAIGAGISLLEFQQNSDVTYRLYDYGRPRELHLDDGIAVSLGEPYPEECSRPDDRTTDAILLDGPRFSLVRANSADAVPFTISSRRRWVMPLKGSIASDGETASAGDCLLVEPSVALDFGKDAIALIGVEGPL